MDLRKILLVVVLVLVGVGYTQPVFAGGPSWGIRGGITDDPDSFFFGGHASFGMSRVRHLRIEPSLEFGIGDEGVDFFTLRGNVHFKYLFVIGRGAALYPLFGPSLYWIHIDDCNGDCSELEVGMNLGFGFSYVDLFFEFALGVADVPDITLTVGYTF